MSKIQDSSEKENDPNEKVSAIVVLLVAIPADDEYSKTHKYADELGYCVKKEELVSRNHPVEDAGQQTDGGKTGCAEYYGDDK